MENDLIKSLNKIKSTINENDQMVWACQASTQCYNEAIKKLKYESERLDKEIARFDSEIKEYKPQVDILEKCVKVQEDTLRISQESLLTHLSYKKCVEENLNKHKTEADTLIKEYSEHYQHCKEKLERTNPIYKTLKEKRTELKKCKIECLILQQRITQRKRIKKLKSDIRKKLFYSDFVSLASAWLGRKKYLAVMKEFEEIKQKEKQCMIRLLEEKENFKIKQKMGYSRKEAKVSQIEFLKNEMKNDMNAVIGGRKTNDLKLFEKPVTNPFYELKDLLEEKSFTPPDPIKTDDSKRTQPPHNNYFPKTEFNSMHSKVRILENKVVKLPQDTTKPVDTPSKEERSKAIDAKLQRVVQNFHRSLSQHHSQKSLKGHSSKLRNGNKSVCSQEEISAKMEVVENCNPQRETGATQELENLNIISQDMNESVLNLLSQDSTKNPESKLKKFKYSPEESMPFLDSKIPEPAEKNGVKIPVMKQTPLKNSQIGTTNLKMDPKSDKSALHKIPDNGFKKSAAISFVKNGQFSMSSGTSPFGGSFANEEQKTESNHFLAKPGSNHIFKADSAHNISNVNNVFKKPEASVVFANQEHNHMDTSNNQTNHATQNEEKNGKQNDFIDESNFLTMGSQYNFGNITQMSQNLNETVDYDVAWSPSVPDFAKSPPTENKSLFSFGQSNAAFGFKF